MKIVDQINKQITGLFVKGNLGKIYNVLSFEKYMKSKVKYLKNWVLK